MTKIKQHTKAKYTRGEIKVGDIPPMPTRFLTQQQGKVLVATDSRVLVNNGPIKIN